MLTKIFEATHEWVDVAYPLSSGGGIDWESEPLSWEEISRLAEQEGLDLDEEMGSSLLTKPRDCDTLLRAGDIVLTTGPGGDVYFLRLQND